MSDEFSSPKRTFISKLNPESPPFHPGSYYHHIQEVTEPKLSSEDNTNHSHIQSVSNGQFHNDNYQSTTIHSIESIEHVPSNGHFIEETIPDNQHSTISSHIQPVNLSNDDSSKQSLISQINDEDVKQYSSEQETDFYTNQNTEEIKTQRELDENEIPPIKQFSTHLEKHLSSNEVKPNITDNLPLNEHQSPNEEYTNNESSSSLPDVIPATDENSNNRSEPDDVLGNKSLMKHVITPGKENTRPTRNSLATVSYKLFLIDSTTSNSRLIETINNETFFVGEYDILPAIDICIQLMDRGEHALIDSDPRHCYGEIGSEEKQIPPTSSTDPYRMQIDIEFHDWKYAPDIQTLSIDERLDWGCKKRQKGNLAYRRKDYSTALQCYRSGIKFLDINEYPLTEENNQSSTLTDQYIQTQNNIAQVHLLNNQYEQCLDAVNGVLKYDSNNIKALFRQGKALFELGNYDQAIQPLKLLLQNQNKDVDKDKVNEMLNICKTKLAKYQKNEKEIYKRMFQPLPSSSTTTINQKSQTKILKKMDNKNNQSWWPYFAMGSAILAAIGLAAAFKYR